MPAAATPDASPAGAEEKARIKLRLHYNGTWTKDGALWRYVGGEVYNESIDASFRYADVCKRLNDKFGDTVSFRYQSPGEELDPEALVQVSGDDDLLEMFSEYVEASKGADGSSRNLRLKVFVYPAVQYEQFADSDEEEQEHSCYEEPLDMDEYDFMDDEGADGIDDEEHLMMGLMMAGPEVDPSVEASCEPEYGGPNWSDYDAEESSLPSAQPSVDTELHQAAAAAGKHPAVFEQVAMHNITTGVSLVEYSSNLAKAAGRRKPAPVAAAAAVAAGAAEWQAPGGGAYGGWQPHVYADAGAGIGAYSGAAPMRGEGGKLRQQQVQLEQQQQGAAAAGAAPTEQQRRGGGADFEPELDDPYGEQETGLQAMAPHAATWAAKAGAATGAQFVVANEALQLQLQALGPPAAADAGQAAPAAMADLFPRHISAFGDSSGSFTMSLDVDGARGARVTSDDGGGGGGCAYGNAAAGGRVQLPSRISVFGDDSGNNTSTDGSAGRPVTHNAHGPGAAGAGGASAFAGQGLHRLAIAGASVPMLTSPEPQGSVGYRAAADDEGGIGRVLTQEFALQQSSLAEPGRHSPGKRLDPLQPLASDGGAGGGLLLGGADADLSPSASALMGVVKKSRSEVVTLNKIGEGAFGEVSQAQVFPYGVVAVKWLKRERFAKYSESFQREAETLARLNHPNIIRMYGLVMDTDGPAQQPGGATGSNGGGGSGVIGGIITEFVRNGSLSQHLRAQNGRRLPLRTRAALALQAALGMAYLHGQSPAVVHFDLKPDNLLVDGEGDCMVIKVADFGLSKHKFSSHVSCRDLRGTLPYMAPELVSSPTQVSEKCDVWSMGVVMWEVLTLEAPFADMTAQSILMGLMHGNLHLAIPPDCEPEWRSLIEMCMDPDPANRPTFQELAMQLQEMLRLERQASKDAAIAALAAAAAAAAAVATQPNPAAAAAAVATQPNPAANGGGDAPVGGGRASPDVGLGLGLRQGMAAGVGVGGAHMGPIGAGAWHPHNYGAQWGMGAPLDFGSRYY